jgi:uncharacterized membrane protein YjjP (DUF1212 family)
VIDQVCEGRLAPEQAAAALEKIRHMPPASTLRFSVMAGLGAMALGVIFGAAHLLSLALIGLSALLGGLLRRGIGRLGDNALIQPFARRAARRTRGRHRGASRRHQPAVAGRGFAPAWCWCRVPTC